MTENDNAVPAASFKKICILIMRGVYFRRRILMKFSTGMYVLWVVTFLWIAWTVYRMRKDRVFQKQIVTLKEGETFVGVIQRGRGQYVFIGNDLARYQENLTPEEIRVLREEFYKGYE